MVLVPATPSSDIAFRATPASLIQSPGSSNRLSPCVCRAGEHTLCWPHNNMALCSPVVLLRCGCTFSPCYDMRSWLSPLSPTAQSARFERIAFSSPLVAIREGFITSLPYVILANVFGLASGILEQFLHYQSDSALFSLLSGFSHALQIFFPHFIVAAIAANFARQYYLGRVSTAAVVLIGYWILSGWIPDGVRQGGFEAEGPFGFWLFPSIFITFPLFLKLSKVRALQMTQVSYLNPLLKDSINLIFPVLATVICLIFLKAVFDNIGSVAMPLLQPCFDVVATLPYLLKVILLVLLIHCAWFIGIHGYNASIELVALLRDQAETGGLIDPSFLELYVHLGGAGTTLSLVIVMLVASRHVQHRRIAGIAAPMALFNINEVILFGLPVIFNLRLLIPFVMTPLVLTVLSYAAQYSGFIPPPQTEISWMMPPLFSAYLATGGSWLAVLFQLLCIAIGVFLYWPFFRELERAGVNQNAVTDIRKKLDIGDHFSLRESAGLPEVRSYLHDIESYRSLATFDDTTQTINLLREGNFLLHYQPQQSLTDGKIAGFEALLRYRDKQGTIHPPTFFQSMKKTGLNDDLERWVIHTACKQLTEWKAAGLDIRMSVNVSADFFSNPALLDLLNAHANQSNALHLLDIEIIEHEVVKNFDTATRTIDELHALGVTISIDDFGAGYSALAYLDTLKPDVIKIDKSLTDVIEQPRGQIIIQQVVDLAHKLDMKIVIEGVEKELQYNIARQLGADVIQGYWVGRPAAASDWQEQLLADTNRH